MAQAVSIVSAHTADTIISVGTVDAPSRYAAAAAARAIVSDALRQQARAQPANRRLTAVARGLSEHPLPNLVMAGSAGDPHMTPCPGRARQPPAQQHSCNTRLR